VPGLVGGVRFVFAGGHIDKDATMRRPRTPSAESSAEVTGKCDAWGDIEIGPSLP